MGKRHVKKKKGRAAKTLAPPLQQAVPQEPENKAGWDTITVRGFYSKGDADNKAVDV